MNLFKHFQKTPFLSQFLLGILAIFALPEIHSNPVESEQATISQRLMQEETVEMLTEQHALFAQSLPEIHAEMPLQAVVFCQSFTKSYRFDGDVNHPIRAGPQFS